jgi:Kef-type K+ transport system membrane component KefB
MSYAYYVANWTLDQAMICGIALSTTSVAVVYAVMVETGLNNKELGKLILAACFVTDLGTVVALGILFGHYDLWLIILLVTTWWLSHPTFAAGFQASMGVASLKSALFLCSSDWAACNVQTAGRLHC